MMRDLAVADATVFRSSFANALDLAGQLAPKLFTFWGAVYDDGAFVDVSYPEEKAVAPQGLGPYIRANANVIRFMNAEPGSAKVPSPALAQALVGGLLADGLILANIFSLPAKYNFWTHGSVGPGIRQICERGKRSPTDLEDRLLKVLLRNRTPIATTSNVVISSSGRWPLQLGDFTCEVVDRFRPEVGDPLKVKITQTTMKALAATVGEWAGEVATFLPSFNCFSFEVDVTDPLLVFQRTRLEEEAFKLHDSNGGWRKPR